MPVAREARSAHVTSRDIERFNRRVVQVWINV